MLCLYEVPKAQWKRMRCWMASIVVVSFTPRDGPTLNRKCSLELPWTILNKTGPYHSVETRLQCVFPGMDLMPFTCVYVTDWGIVSLFGVGYLFCISPLVTARTSMGESQPKEASFSHFSLSCLVLVFFIWNQKLINQKHVSACCPLPKLALSSYHPLAIYIKFQN